MRRRGIVAFQGSPLTLVGPAVRVGDRAPDFTVLDGDMKDVHLSDFAGKIKVISVTPSLDTPVCDLQLRRFNQEASAFPDDVAVINMSMDLPFAIKRFCTSAGIDRVTGLSDHRDASFGTNYGVVIEEMRLLARAIFILDKYNTVRYAEIVPEMSRHPDYERALGALRDLTGIRAA